MADAARLVALSDLLQIGPAIEVMAEEGLAYGRDLEAGMFPGQGGPGWEAVVALIYDPATMRERFDAAFVDALAGSPHVGAIEAFFGSDLGQRALTLEVSARRALLDPEVEEAAKLAYSGIAADAPRLRALRQFVEVNDLIESNVMGALNANLAFFQGMAELTGLDQAVPEDQMLADVWAQEGQVRQDTEDWLMPFLALAYKPLSDEDLAAYQAFSESDAGQALNAALFAAFDVLFTSVSRDLGRAAGRQVQGQDL
ncbi:MAG: hypothetical protein ACRC14_13055 [Paracoccaceae bacterium]